MKPFWIFSFALFALALFGTVPLVRPAETPKPTVPVTPPTLPQTPTKPVTRPQTPTEPSTIPVPKTTPSPIRPIKPSNLVNWYELNSANWPVAPPNEPNPNSGKRFYYIRDRPASESEKPFLALKKNFFNDVQLFQDSRFNFQYWTNNDAGYFSGPGNRLKLSEKLAWKTMPQLVIEKQQWEGFHFINLDNFVMALRDVSVKYFGDIYMKSTTLDPISGFKGHNQTLGIDLGNPYVPNPPGTLILHILRFVPFIELLVHPSSNDRHVNLVLPYLNTETTWTNQKNSNPNCFRIAKSSVTQVWIDLYFTFENANRGQRLFRIPGNQTIKDFCLDSYIYLNRMNQFQLSLVVEEKLDKQFVIDFSRTVGSHSVVQQAPGAKINDGWLFMNSRFDFGFDGPSSGNGSNVFYACDIVANCFPFDGVGDSKSTRYTLNDAYKRILLGSTPFIRIYSELLDSDTNPKLDSLYHLNYNSANSASIDRIRSLKDYSAANIQLSANHDSFHYTANVYESGSKTFQYFIPIPLGSIDLRTQEVLVSASIVAQDESYLKLVELSCEDSSSKKILNWSGINLNSGKQFNISTRDYFAVGPFESPEILLDSVFNIVLEVDIGDKTQTHGHFVQLNVDIQVKSMKHVIQNDGAEFEIYPKEIQAIPFPDLNTKIIRLEQSPKLLLLTDWLLPGNRAIETYASNIFKFVSSNKSSNLNEKTLTVKRIVIGSRGDHFTTETLKLHYNTNVATLMDSIDTKLIPQSGNYFKVGYMIEQTEGAEVEVEFEGKFNHPLNGFTDNCKRVPTISESDCVKRDVVQFKCPSFFEYDPQIGSCQLTHLYEYVHEECNIATGCSNILDRPLPSSTTYANPDGSSKYTPIVGTKIDQNYLTISRPAHAQNGDFCIHFDYMARDVQLVVSSSPTDLTHAKVFGITSGDELSRNQMVCASSLVDKDAGSVKEMFFVFKPLTNSENIELGRHLITNLSG